MKIVHVVTYVSEDGAFGGPIAVAIAQLEELSRQGHEVELLAGWDGKAKLSPAGVNVRLFKVRRLRRGGFSGLFAPGLARAARAHAKAGAAIHVHLARDLVTMPAALAVASYVKPVIQTHGMVMPDQRLLARMLDHIFTKAILRHARRVLTLTPSESQGVKDVANDSIAVETIANGLRAKDVSTRARRTNEILFLARLHPRKRVLAFGEMCKILVQSDVPVRCVVVGPDEGDLPRLRAFISENSLDQHLFYEGVLPTGDAIGRLSEAAVYVLPSTGEVFPMTVLEALAAGTPVVTTSSSGIAPHLVALEAAEVNDGTPEDLASAVLRLLDDEPRRAQLVVNGRVGLATKFSIEAVVRRLESLYGER
ncbi:glycosyltransferase [Pseudarthrobacter oxydans]|uniref:glycosyltransferase n=1 Tax=Pseudarthrobacter oxydans TaxID=1671 RepID=UPI0034318567